MMQTLLDLLIQKFQADPKTAAYLVIGFSAWRLVAVLASTIDNSYPGKIDGRILAFIVFVSRIVNRYATDQGAARSIVAAVRPNRTASRDDGDGRLNWTRNSTQAPEVK